MALMGHSQSSEGVYISIENLLDLRHAAKDLTLNRRKKSSAMIDGDSRTHFRGRGMEFSEVRPYQPGDDIRNIDWRVTARTQSTYTKLFQEERERPVYLLVDQRAPMFFGSARQFKSVFAAKISAIIAWAALQNNDRVGALIFSDDDQTDSKARRGKHAVLNTLHQLHTYNHRLKSPLFSPENPAPRNTMLDMLHDIRRVAKPGSAVFIISDFHDFDQASAEPLSILARHSDVTAIHVYDKLESQLPSRGHLTISNGERKLIVSGQSKTFAEAYHQSFENTRFALRKACNSSASAFASVSVDQTAEQLAMNLFMSRRKKRS